CRLVLEIAGEATSAWGLLRVAHKHLPGLAVWHVAIGIINDTDIDARHSPPEGTRSYLTRLKGVAQHADHLRHAPDLEHRKTEALLERLVQLRLDAGTDAEADAMAPLDVAGRLVEQQGRDHPEVMDDGGPCLRHLTPPALRRKAIGLNLAAASQDGAHQGDDGGVDV